MKRLRREGPLIVAIAALIFASFSSFVRAQTTVPLPSGTPPDKAAVPVLVAKIAVNLSTRNAKTGDVITAKTLKATKLKDGTEIPKGSTLTGRVAMIRSKKAGSGNSLLTFRFDQLEPKGGAAIPIHGLVVAIGPLRSPKNLFGANSVMARDGTGSSNGIDPNAGLGSAGARDESDIPLGSTMEGVALGHHLDADWTTALQGVKTDIDLDSDVVIKVQLK
jgi:hypothetical protein